MPTPRRSAILSVIRGVNRWRPDRGGAARRPRLIFSFSVRSTASATSEPDLSTYGARPLSPRPCFSATAGPSSMNPVLPRPRPPGGSRGREAGSKFLAGRPPATGASSAAWSGPTTASAGSRCAAPSTATASGAHAFAHRRRDRASRSRRRCAAPIARKDEFLATLAHELRNPLAPIRNAAARSCG